MATAGKESIENHVELLDLNRWLGKIFPGVRFWVKFDRLRDVFIDAKFLTAEMVQSGKKLEFRPWSGYLKSLILSPGNNNTFP